MSPRSPVEQRTLALAGVAQAARIVDLAAKTGSWPTPFVEASIHSLFCFDPDAVDTVFGTPQGIRLGLEQLSACLGLSQDEASADTLRYTLAILQLERRFAARDDLQAIVHSRLKHTAYKAENFSSDIKGLSANISSIYQDTLSTLPYRIKVTGSAQHLNNPHVADRGPGPADVRRPSRLPVASTRRHPPQTDVQPGASKRERSPHGQRPRCDPLTKRGTPAMVNCGPLQ